MRATTPASTSKKANPPETRVRLEQLAHQFAEQHTVDKGPKQKTYRLLEHLQNWEQTLQNAYTRFRVTPSKELPFSRASEWMLDNFYVVKQAFHQIEEALPKHYFDELPKLNATTLKGYPRIFALALELVGYSQSQLDLAQVTTFVQNYQQVTPLTIGEIWAFPTMLRIGILESLAVTVAAITGIPGPESLNASPILPLPRSATNETIVANCFLSLRLLSATDWKSFFEETSQVEQVLRDDPAKVYPDMDFETRNMYRSVVEELSRHSNQTEEAVAQAAIEFARDAQEKSQVGERKHNRKTHVGFYLIDNGRLQLEKHLAYRLASVEHLRRWFLAYPTLAYLGSIGLLSLLIISGLLYYTYAAYVTGNLLAQLLIVGVFGSGLAIETAIGLLHWDITHQLPPRSLPRMDFSEGIAANHRTMVVIPTLLANDNEVDSLLQELEIHFLSNPDPQLAFALLSDFMDAPQQHMDADEQVLARAKAGIEALNHKYGQAAPFYLFHRERKWNPSQGVWMGWERKRGKLTEFNRLILNAGQTSYTTQLGRLNILHEIKYVITLDADTSLPQGSANRLVATLAHPLNQAEFAPDGRTVTAGYTVLQPRVEIKPTSANRSTFSRIFAGDTGFDLYTLAISDVYQDLFGEGSYIGKGIYDVVGFEKSLEGQVRENTLLSHDLFEGIHGRAALVTDIILYEEYPSTYLVYARRLRRWIRGDWQLLPWLLPILLTEKGWAHNPLSMINRWKVFDNLRRSLLAPTTMLLLIAAWLALPGSPLVWTVLILLPPTLPIIFQSIDHIRQNIGKLPFNQLMEPSKRPVLRWALAILFLPYESFLALGAITVTLIRLLITRKHMLQWTTAAHTARLFRVNTKYEIRAEITISVVFTMLIGAVVMIANPSAMPVAVPLLLAWLASPQVAYWISEPIIRTPVSAPLSEIQRKQLQRLARRTWAFFEQFAGPEDHWLPPDQFQESARDNIAHDPTPSNIG